MRQPEIATHMSVTKVKVTVAKETISAHNLNLIMSIDALLCVCVVNINRQLGIVTQMSVIKVYDTV